MRKMTGKTLLIIFIITLTASGSPAQDDRVGGALRGQMIEFLRYMQLEKSATPADINRLVELWSKAAQQGLSLEERSVAFRDLYIHFKKLQGIDYSGRPQVLDGLARTAATAFQGGAALDLRLPEPRGPIAGDYIHVDTQGRGPLRMLLISAGGVDGRELYRSFVERHKDSYTMYVVTLPGAGLAKPLPWPEVYDLTRRPWLNNIEQSLVRLVEKKAKHKLVIIGTAAGGYFAARLALLKPEKVRAAVLVDALVNVTMRSPAAPDRPATLQERLTLMKGFMPSPQLFPLADVPNREEIRKLLDDPNSSHPAVKNWMAFGVKNEALSKRWTLDALAGGFFRRGLRYGFELQTTDLAEDFKSLSVPTLVMSALHDDKSPRAGVSGGAQWEGVKRLYPSIPLSITTFINTRSYISEDNPAKFDSALREFLAGNPK
jgi:pimeloyl-ACP methyl ester carboxylesterase